MLNLLPMLFTLVSADVRVRVVNEADCSVRVQVLQRGAYLKTIALEPRQTREVTVKASAPDVPLTYRVLGTSCQFDRYELAGAATPTHEEVRVSQIPSLAGTRPLP
jgi:hypothetical protein